MLTVLKDGNAIDLGGVTEVLLRDGDSRVSLVVGSGDDRRFVRVECHTIADARAYRDELIAAVDAAQGAGADELARARSFADDTMASYRQFRAMTLNAFHRFLADSPDRCRPDGHAAAASPPPAPAALVLEDRPGEPCPAYHAFADRGRADAYFRAAVDAGRSVRLVRLGGGRWEWIA